MTVAPPWAAAPPHFEDLILGQRFDEAPGMTLTSGAAATHQAIVGDRLALALDHDLARQVTGAGALAHPALVWDVAIGQSTFATQRVVGNLYYRGLTFQRAPRIGDTLRTTTEITGLRANRARAGRAPTGLAVLRVTTVDQHRRPVLDFERCAMVAARNAAEDEVDLPELPKRTLSAISGTACDGWDLDAMGGPLRSYEPGAAEMEAGDVVSCAPELVRLSLNLAIAHADAVSTGGRRLVYGGQTIAIAASHVVRALPGVVWFIAWHSCDHLAPVYENDTLHSKVAIEQVVPRASGGSLLSLRCEVTATGEAAQARLVLDWKPVVLAR